MEIEIKIRGKIKIRKRIRSKIKSKIRIQTVTPFRGRDCPFAPRKNVHFLIFQFNRLLRPLAFSLGYQRLVTEWLSGETEAFFRGSERRLCLRRISGPPHRVRICLTNVRARLGLEGGCHLVINDPLKL